VRSPNNRIAVATDIAAVIITYKENHISFSCQKWRSSLHENDQKAQNREEFHVDITLIVSSDLTAHCPKPWTFSTPA